MFGDPARAVEILEAKEIKREEDMGRNLTSVSGQIQNDLYQWGDWARRPQFWENLGVTPFCRLIGLYTSMQKDIKLDPQSMAIHKAVMSLDQKYQIVLYAYYVANVHHEDMPAIFNGRGVSRATFYRRLDAASVMAHNKAKRWLEMQKKYCETI
ncbi:MAG: hypothetical protein CL536_07940 [Alcaligenaceae bacterium]|nr:hypothetical protein [Alcaligenaceae bacterium]